MTPRRASHAKAQQRRARSLAQLNTWSDIQQLAGHTERPPTQPFTLVIEIDAWNIRERGDWGQTKELLLRPNRASIMIDGKSTSSFDSGPLFPSKSLDH